MLQGRYLRLCTRPPAFAPSVAATRSTTTLTSAALTSTALAVTPFTASTVAATSVAPLFATITANYTESCDTFRRSR